MTTAAKWSRSDLLAGLTPAASAAVLGLRFESAHAEPPPETTRRRWPRTAVRDVSGAQHRLALSE